MIIAGLVVLGLILGSFVNALVWRLHEQAELAGKKAKDKKVKLKELSVWNGRSECVHCHHKLAAIDLIPVLSWLMLHGKCRYCRKPISLQYPIVELSTAGVFVFSYVFWPFTLHGIGLYQLIVWLAMLVGFMALLVYDLRWFILPNKIVYPLLTLAAIQAVVLAFAHKGTALAWAPLWGLLIIAGTFYVIFQFSEGKWIGGGDVKLGAMLGLLVGGPANSILLLFLASIGGTLYSLPLMIAGKANRRSHVPFGPFLIIAGVITYLFGAGIINWYKHLII